MVMGCCWTPPGVDRVVIVGLARTNLLLPPICMTLVVMVLVGATVETTGVDPEGEIVFTTIVPVGLLPSAV